MHTQTNTRTHMCACVQCIAGIIKSAKNAGVGAIHPGYGFLSENAVFARKCEEAGIAFVGPKPETLEVRVLSDAGA